MIPKINMHTFRRMDLAQQNMIKFMRMRSYAKSNQWPRRSKVIRKWAKRFRKLSDKLVEGK